MKITICGSIQSTYEMEKAAQQLKKAGYDVESPYTSQKILSGELSMEEFLKEKKNNGDGAFRKMKHDLITRYYKIIGNSDAILVINMDKNNIKNYIGGNTFLEMGFAHVLKKPIYLWNPIPDMLYTDEIISMQPIIINNDINKIKSV